MSGKPIWDGFHMAWEDFKHRDKHFELITNYMESSEGREALNLDLVNNIISIGAGTGELEYKMMNLCPNLKEMTLLDPDCHQCDSLEERFQGERRVKVQCQNMPFESFEGPKESFDFVFCCQVFYHFPDMEHQFDRALSLVRKGGKLVVIIDQSNIIGSVLVASIGINEEHGVYSKLKSLFNKRMLKYKEKELPNEFDFSHSGKDGIPDLIDLASNKSVPNKQKLHILREFERRNAFIPGTRIIKATTSVFVINKE